MYQITIDDKNRFIIESSKEGIFLDKSLFKWDCVEYEAGKFHILYENKTYNVEVVSEDYKNKVFTLKVNRKLIELNAKDKLDILLTNLGIDIGSSQKLNDIKAPMPGLVIDIYVKEGQEIKKGDKLLVLEAMKMENVLKSPGSGVIKELKINKGDKIEKKQLMIVFK